MSALGVVFEPVAGAEITADPELGVGDFDYYPAGGWLRPRVSLL